MPRRFGGLAVSVWPPLIDRSGSALRRSGTVRVLLLRPLYQPFNFLGDVLSIRRYT
jgi:ABC-type uncharacterized transport system permease subunit